MPQQRIWTIGHSTHSLETFLEMLLAHKVEVLADVRRFPASRKYPHFNATALADQLAANQIAYCHFENLGGRRPTRKDSPNTVWRNDSFRGYADYMETAEFEEAITELMKLASAMPTAMMCAEAVWWRCHRGLVSDYLKVRGWHVLHIMTADKAEPHPYTSAARIENGELKYSAVEEQLQIAFDEKN